MNTRLIGTLLIIAFGLVVGPGPVSRIVLAAEKPTSDTVVEIGNLSSPDGTIGLLVITASPPGGELMVTHFPLDLGPADTINQAVAFPIEGPLEWAVAVETADGETLLGLQGVVDGKTDREYTTPLRIPLAEDRRLKINNDVDPVVRIRMPVGLVEFTFGSRLSADTGPLTTLTSLGKETRSKTVQGRRGPLVVSSEPIASTRRAATLA